MLEEIFSGKCPCCGEKSPITEPLCHKCFGELESFSLFCFSCGFPLKAAGAYCPRCARKTCAHVDRFFIPYGYSGSMRNLLLSIKFKYNVRSALTLFKLLEKTFLPLFRYDAVIPVPSHFLRRFRRFFHPADVTASYLCSVLKVPLDGALSRVRYTDFQYRLNAAERSGNVKKAFGYSPRAEYSSVLLVDDILTTGATLEECACLLKKAGVKKVDCYILAKD